MKIAKMKRFKSIYGNFSELIYKILQDDEGSVNNSDIEEETDDETETKFENLNDLSDDEDEVDKDEFEGESDTEDEAKSGHYMFNGLWIFFNSGIFHRFR